MAEEQSYPTINPADMPLVTLDANPLIALWNGEPEAPAVQTLFDMNRAAQIVIQVTLSTALEAGPAGQRFVWPDRVVWLEDLGIAKGNIFTGPRTVGFINPADPDVTFFGPMRETQLNVRVHHIVHPTIPFYWYDYRDAECVRAGLSAQAMVEYDQVEMGMYIPPTPQHPQQMPTPHFDALNPVEQAQVKNLHEQLRRTWNNAKNDSLGLHNHLTVAACTTHPEWSVFVTSDNHFLKASKLAKLSASGFKGEILRPHDAVTFLQALRHRSQSE